MSRRCLVVVAFAAVGLVAARADVVQNVPVPPGAEVTIKLSTPAASLPRFGFAPMRVTIENAAAQERTWQVSFEAGMRNQFPGLALTERAIVVPAGQTRDTWIFVPLAEPSTNVAPLLPPGSPAGASGFPGGLAPRVSIVKTLTGTKITVVRMSSRGTPLITEETDIDATTGTKTTTSTSGGMSNTSSNTPPKNMTVTYTINQDTGFISTNLSAGTGTTVGGSRVNIVRSNSVAPGSTLRTAGGTSGPTPKVTIVDTPVGTKVTRVTQFGAGSTLTQEQEIDASTGVMTTITTSSSGVPSPPRSSSPAMPGSELTFTIDPVTGNVRTNQRRGSDPTAAPKITIIKGASPSAGAATLSTTGSPGIPVIGNYTVFPTILAADFSGPGLNGGARLVLPNTNAGSPMRPFAVSAALDPVVRGKLAAVVHGAPNLSAVEPALLPADWRVWSSFAAVILPSDEYAALDAGRRAALRGWVALGGRVWLSPSAPGEGHVEPLGAGLITTLAEPLSAAPAKPAGPSAKAAPVTLDEATADLWVNKIQIYGATPGLPDRDALNLAKSTLGEAVQAPGTTNTWLAIFLVTFAVVVGPVNLFVLAPVKKRHRLFLTTPLIALAASGVLATTILTEDGLGGEGMRRTLVVLLPGANEAAVFQEQTARTGFLTHRSFAVPDDTQLTVLSVDETDTRMSFTPFTAELTRIDGRASGDWFRNRSRQAQLLQRLAPTRGRVEQVGAAAEGAPIVESSLATTLRSFVCVGAGDVLWTAPELPPGKRVTLTRGGSWMASGTLGGSRRFGEVLEAAAPQTPGQWSAHGGATDLAPIATLDSVRWTDADVLFTGRLEGGAATAKEAGR